MRKLPVFRSVGEVFSGVTRHYFQLIGVAWPALLFVLIAMGLYGWSFQQAGIGELATMAEEGASAAELSATYVAIADRATGPVYYLAFLLTTFASAVAAVRWHRFVLMGEGGSILLRMEDARYVWTFIKVMLAYFLMLVLFIAAVAGIGAVTGMIGGDGNAGGAGVFGGVLAMGMVVVYLLILGLFMRLMLALPDVAIGMPGKVRTILKATEGNTWRMVGYTVLIGIIYLVALVILLTAGSILGSVLGGPVAVALFAILAIAAYFYFLMLSITMLSVAYREIVGLPGGHEGEATVAEPSPGL